MDHSEMLEIDALHHKEEESNEIAEECDLCLRPLNSS